jgi:hypothetical protein
MYSVIGLWLLALLALAPTACDTVPDYPNRPLATGAANPPPADLIGLDPGAPLILIAFSGGGSRAAALGLGVLRRPGAPLVVMNATDMESGEVFAFTPQRFDDLCSDPDHCRSR